MNEPDNELYDAACDLLGAAQRLTRAARGGDVERAVPATLGCLEATLSALDVAWATLETAARCRGADVAALRRALREAERAADAARAAAAAAPRLSPPVSRH